jgi:hypothetical protein
MLTRSEPKGKWVVTDFQSICNAVNIPIGEKAEPKSFIIIIIEELGKPNEVFGSAYA